MSVLENFWANKAACDDAERAYYEKLSGCKVTIIQFSSLHSPDIPVDSDHLTFSPVSLFGFLCSVLSSPEFVFILTRLSPDQWLDIITISDYRPQFSYYGSRGRQEAGNFSCTFPGVGLQSKARY